MSLLNVLLLGDKAYVAVDTATFVRGTDHVFDSCKMLPLGSAGVVIAGRGTPDLLYHFGMSLLALVRNMDFDTIQDVMPGLIDDWFNHVNKWYAAMGRENCRPSLSGQQLVVAGWSSREGRMSALSFERPQDATHFAVTRVERELCCPAYEDDLRNLVVPNATAYMQEVAAAQMRTYRSGKLEDGVVIGGALQVAEMTRQRITIFEAGSL